MLNKVIFILNEKDDKEIAQVQHLTHLPRVNEFVQFEEMVYRVDEITHDFDTRNVYVYVHQDGPKIVF